MLNKKTNSTKDLDGGGKNADILCWSHTSKLYGINLKKKS